MRVDAFDFHLPPDRIAQRPVIPRDAARLLHVAADGFRDRGVFDLPSLLAPGDLLVFNDTRVIPARLTGERRGVKISVTLHQPVAADRWRAFAKPAKRLTPGDTIGFATDLSAEVISKEAEGDVILQFSRAGAALRDALDRHGAIPLPPYIRDGIADEQDRTDYQTLFARQEGAVAAPTAALHFTPSLMADLAEQGVQTACLTLHVGAGTFLPVKAADTEDHRMHGEWGQIDPDTADLINETRAKGGKIVAVGTTSLRLLETAAMDDGAIRPFEGSTAIFITPGYRFKAIDRLLTNFHLPRSTLFMLVSAYAGLERMQAAYAHAIEAGYRFYSYGDCCLLEPALAE